LPQQLPLDLETPDRFSREQFIVTPGLQAVLDVLLCPETWLGEHLILWGAEGSGKSHLGHLFADHFIAHYVSAAESFAQDAAQLHVGSYVVDDAEMASEDFLFHLCNHTNKFQKNLVLLTKIHPLDWNPNLPDLGSRIRAMRLLAVPEPDQSLLISILNKLFAQRAISPSPDFIDYLAKRMDRSVKAAQKIVTDIELYANGRPFNRALARDFIDETSALSQPDNDDANFESF